MVRVFGSVVYLRMRSHTYGLDYVSYGTILRGKYRRGDVACTYAWLDLIQGGVTRASVGLDISSFPVGTWHDFDARMVFSTMPSYKVAPVDKVYKVTGVARNIPIPLGKAMVVVCFGVPPSTATVLDSTGKAVAILVPHETRVYGMDAVVLVPDYDNEPVTIDASLCDFCLYSFLDIDTITIARETFTVRVLEKCGSVERVYPLSFPGLSLFVSEIAKALINPILGISAKPAVTYVPPRPDPSNSAWMPSEGWTHVWQFDSQTELNDFEYFGAVSVSNGTLYLGSDTDSGDIGLFLMGESIKQVAIAMKATVYQAGYGDVISSIYVSTPNNALSANIQLISGVTDKLNLCDGGSGQCTAFSIPPGFMVFLVDVYNQIAKVFDSLGNEIVSVSLTSMPPESAPEYRIGVDAPVYSSVKVNTEVDWIAINNGSGIRNIVDRFPIDSIKGYAYHMTSQDYAPPLLGGTGSFDTYRSVYVVSAALNSSGYASFKLGIVPSKIGVALKVNISELSNSSKIAQLSISDGLNYGYYVELWIDPGTPPKLRIVDTVSGLVQSVDYNGDWILFVLDRSNATAYIADRYGNSLASVSVSSGTPGTAGCSVWVGAYNYPGSAVLTTLVDYIAVDPVDGVPVVTSLGSTVYNPVFVLHFACAGEPNLKFIPATITNNGFSIDYSKTLAVSQSSVQSASLVIEDDDIYSYAFLAVSLSISSSVTGLDIVRITIDDGSTRYDAAIRTASSTSQIELYDYVSGTSKVINLPSGWFIVLLDTSRGVLEVYDTSGNLIDSISISGGSSVQYEKKVAVYGYSNYNGATVTTSVDWVAYG